MPHAVEKFRQRYRMKILSRFFVRWHMSLILAAVIASGVSVSKLLLEAGATSVRFRYPLAVFLSYLVFLLLVRIWAWSITPARYRRRSEASSNARIPDFSPSGGGSHSPAAGSGFQGFGGGDSGGAGATANWEVSPDASKAAVSSTGDSGGWGALDPGDLGLIVIALAAVIFGIFGSSLYLIYIAPELLPEVALQVALASGLVRVSAREDPAGWLRGVVRSSWIPFVSVLASVVVLALAIDKNCPQAVKLADAFHCPAAR